VQLATSGDVKQRTLLALMAAVAVSTMCMIVFLCFFSARLYTNAYWQDHADTLIIEMVARDLLAGGSILDWRLTQAPYVFPDIALATIAAPFVGDGQVGKLVQFALLFIGAPLWYALARRLGVSTLPSLLVGAFFCALFALGFLHTELNSNAALYLGLPGHHSSLSAMLPLALLCTFSLTSACFQPEQNGHSAITWRRVVEIAVSWTALTALVTSDGTLDIVLLGPAVLLCSLLAVVSGLRRQAGLGSYVFAAVGLSTVVLASELLHGGLPYPQKSEFFRFMLQRVKIDFPSIPIASAIGLGKAPFESWGTFVLVCASALAFCWLLLNQVRRGPTGRWIGAAPTPTTMQDLAISGFVIGVALLPVVQIALGMWTGLEAYRQVSWAMLSLMVLAAIALLRSGRLASIAFIAVVTFVLATVAAVVVAGNRRTSYESRYARVVSCLEKSYPAGIDLVGEFWDVLPLTAHSHGKFTGLAFADPLRSPVAFTNGQKISRLRSLRPTVAVLRPGSSPDAYRAFFGAPGEVLDCDGQLFLDYSGSEPFKARFSDLATRAY